MNKVRRIGFVVGLLLSVAMHGELFAQLECTPSAGLPDDYFSRNDLYRGQGTWQGAVFQLSPSFEAGNSVTGVLNDWNFNFSGASNANRVFKGYLQRNESFIPASATPEAFASGLNFYTNFLDPLNSTSGSDADSFFPTSSTINGANSDGCQVEGQLFGVILRSSIIIPEAGIYRIQVGSDDGSFLRVRANGNPVNLVGTEDEMVHTNYFKTSNLESPFFDGLNNFVYRDNIKSYLVEFTGGEEVWFDLTYYEMRGRSELSFQMERYFGAGEIGLNGFRGSFQTVCAANPDPPAFDGVYKPAVFQSGVVTDYRWQYSLTTGATATWIDIPGATSWDYDIPAYQDDTDRWTGTRYFRRVATDRIDLGNGSFQNVDFFSNVIGIERSVFTADFDENEFGNNEWIAHIYDNARSFVSRDYMGQHKEAVNFTQNFGVGIRPRFTPSEFGCSFEAEYFTVRYKMIYSFKKDTEYTFNLLSDDGSRLYVDGQLLIDSWEVRTAGTISSSPSFMVEEDTDLEMILEYYELTGEQVLSFSITEVFNPYVVEWGVISGEPCGTRNCLSWETTKERNNREFIIERSYDGNSWSPLGDPIPGQANSTQSRLYSFIDDSFLSVGSYYRIKRIAMDDSIDYSETIRIDNETFGSRLIPYPNPTANSMKLFAPGGIRSVRITSPTGGLDQYLPYQSLGQYMYEIDLSIFPGNVYVITVESEESTQKYKVIKR